jgi:hypothetical protein
MSTARPFKVAIIGGGLGHLTLVLADPRPIERVELRRPIESLAEYDRG